MEQWELLQEEVTRWWRLWSGVTNNGIMIIIVIFISLVFSFVFESPIYRLVHV